MRKDFIFNSIVTILKYIFTGCVLFGIISLFIQDAIAYVRITLSAISELF